ncbi:MAG TPA: TadE/TadG family type IV pilus assembly protein [Rhizomicrobium sp.]|nr:TadE/TadG family type IV pilus assembly protein [Rhizomicrobium sp.]
MRKLWHYLHEERGASSAEFALVMFPFLGLVFAIIGGAMMFYANQSLQYATEAAARYYSVQTTNTGTPPSTSTIQTYAQNAYTGPGISTSFTAARGGCGANGFQVTGSATFPLNIGILSQSIALKSHACFP